MRRKTIAVLCFLLAPALCWGQDDRRPGGQPPPTKADAEFLQAADEVMAQMSKLLSLPIREPLKRSVRSREEIRQFLIRQMKDDKDDAKRYADRRALEALGLIPKDYPLDQKLLSLLTEQIAGLYDPKEREFFIADWTNPAEQRMIMAHELTHALQDQYFHVEQWEEAVKSNDDAQLARESVLEGSAMIAMIDYLLRTTGKSSRDITDLDPTMLLGDVADSPELSQAPLILQDEIVFPYGPGASFVQRALKEWSGWPDLHKLFENPPASTQQILHPDLYFRGVAPAKVDLAPVTKAVPAGWKKLDENVLGEFGTNEVFKQFLGKERADDLSPSWTGDRYAIYQRESGTRTLLVIRMKLSDDTAAARFFGAYSDLLEKKNENRKALLRRPNFFSFETPDGGVFLRCVADECLIAEGSTREMFEGMTRAIHWPAGPLAPRRPTQPGTTTARQGSTPAGRAALRSVPSPAIPRQPVPVSPSL